MQWKDEPAGEQLYEDDNACSARGNRNKLHILVKVSGGKPMASFN
jgi:hypothetical protein